MKKFELFLLSTLLLIFTGSIMSVTAAVDVWSIGVDDGNFAEFAAAGNYNNVPKLASQGVNIQIGKFDPKKDFPYIQPGPSDNWAGNKNYTYSIQFDLPENITENTAETQNNLTYELIVKGWGHYASPTVFEVSLNGQKKVLATSPNAQNDNILNNPDPAHVGTYSVTFPQTAVKKTGNILTITSTNGSWFVYDCLKLQTRTGKIEAVNITPIRGIFKIPNEKFPARKIKIDYKGEFLNQNANLDITYHVENEHSENDKQKHVRIVLNPENNFNDAEISLPLTDDNCAKPLKIRAELKLPETEIIAQETSIPAERKWEIYLIHQTHLDIGFTHIQTDVLKRQVQSIRDALRYIDETKNYPDEAKFRFHPEGMWAVDQFLKEADDDEKAAFVKAAKNRDLHIDGMYAQAMTGMYNDEELFELFADAVRFCRENGIVLDSVMQTDVPGYTWGLVTAMAQNGIKYMTMGPNCGHRIGRVYAWGDKPFWWVSPSGNEKVLCWLLDTGYHQFHGKPLGHIISENEVFKLLSGSSGHYIHPWGQPESEEKHTFLFDDLVVVRYNVEADNGRPNRALSDAVKMWNEKYLYPKLIVSRNSDVMKLLEKRYGDKLPVVRGDYTPYWEDGSASTSEATAINRRAKEHLIQAGVLWAMFQPKNYPKTNFDTAWTDLIMYDEHTWGAHNSISEPDSDFVKTQDDYKQEYARRGFRETNELVDQSTKLNVAKNDTTNNVAAKPEKTLWVNTLSRKRDGICYVGKAAKDFEGTQTLRIFKTPDGKQIPVQYIADPDGKNTCSMYADLSRGVSAPNIPALGFLEVEPDKTATETATFDKTGSFHVNAETGEMRSRRIHLTIDKNSGTIKSLKIPGSAHEFVDVGSDGNRGLNDYLYIIGRNAAENRERTNPPEAVRLTVLANGPLAASMLVEINDGVPNATSLKRQITIFEDNEKIRIENVLDKKMERKPEGTFFGFPFNIPDGQWYIDTAWALTQVEKDQIPGANRNYYCVQRYCTLANENCGINWVTVDANMIQFTPILFTEPWGLKDWRKNFEAGQPNGTLYSWVCNNHWETNYKAGQDGQLTFEYWIWPYVKATFNNSIAQRFARQVHQPILQLNADHSTVNLKLQDSEFLKLENEGNVIISSIKPARDGSGALIVRLFNPTLQVQETKIVPSGQYKTIYQSNPCEEKLNSFTTQKLNPMETITVRIE
ncbi:MAG: glycosyl hydrolase-related protein [Planctomycetaceae bacterium]|jgi:hypothetical protein|nr:glycosyl hydrolase-related protein [Planctomycetaceae bacterium]